MMFNITATNTLNCSVLKDSEKTRLHCYKMRVMTPILPGGMLQTPHIKLVTWLARAGEIGVSVCVMGDMKSYSIFQEAVSSFFSFFHNSFRKSFKFWKFLASLRSYIWPFIKTCLFFPPFFNQRCRRNQWGTETVSVMVSSDIFIYFEQPGGGAAAEVDISFDSECWNPCLGGMCILQLLSAGSVR